MAGKMLLDRHLHQLFELLSIPSISAQTEHKKDIKYACEWLKNRLSSLNFTADILSTKGHPVVYAEKIIAPNLPTLLIYGHYDVQSPDPINEWSSDPFKPEVRSGNIYARGVADDKGQLYTWIAAIDELKVKSEKLKVNLKFLIEGEEEVGSKNLGEFVKDNKSLLATEICVISDSHALSETQPLIEYGLRGLAYAEVTIKTMPKDVHSGLYGGNVMNPVQILSEVISRLKNEEGKILIPDFYGNVRKISAKEKNSLIKFPFTQKEVLAETGAEVEKGEPGFSVQERAGTRPTLEVNGIWGGYLGEGPKTIIPGEAHAKISMRLVPYQNSEEAFSKFRDYFIKIIPKGAQATVELLSSAEPILLDIGSIFFKKAEEAYKKTFGRGPLYGLSGGTIGVVADFKNILDVDSILMGYGLPDDGLHSPNEKFSIEMFKKGIKTNIEFLLSL